MPIKFDRELSAVKDRVVAMGDTVQDMIRTAMRVFVERDEELIDQVMRLEDLVDRAQIDIDNTVVRLMATFGPVALDLRFVLMTARINTELERIGDQAVNMCDHAKLLLAEPELKRLVDLPRMADIASRMVKDSLQAYRTGSTTLARDVIKADNEVDGLNDQIFRELITYMMADVKNIARSLALILTARSLERIADHATNVAEEVIYMVKGEDVRHSEVRP